MKTSATELCNLINKQVTHIDPLVSSNISANSAVQLATAHEPWSVDGRSRQPALCAQAAKLASNVELHAGSENSEWSIRFETDELKEDTQ